MMAYSLCLLSVACAVTAEISSGATDEVATFESLAQVASSSPEWCKKVPLDQLKSTPPCAHLAQTLLKFAQNKPKTPEDEWFEAGTTSITLNPTTWKDASTVYTGSLGSNIAVTLMQWKALNAPLSGVKPPLAFSGYTLASAAPCDPNLGYHYVPTGGITKDKPLSLYYTAAGQIAGMRVELFGEGAASGAQVSGKYWVGSGPSNQWHLSVSFRAAEYMCDSGKTDTEVVGDRVVLNADGIAKSLPMTGLQAEQAGFTPGSCMKTMGQHHFYDLATAPKQSWDKGNLMPVTPMYLANGGALNAFLFASPVCQVDSGTMQWDNVPSMIGCGLPIFGMCENFCDKTCSTNNLGFGNNPWAHNAAPAVKNWATMHIFFNSDAKNKPTCPSYSVWNGSGGVAGVAMQRTCPANVAESPFNGQATR